MLSLCCEAVVTSGAAAVHHCGTPLSRSQELFLVACMSLVRAVMGCGAYKGRTAGGGIASRDNPQVTM